jgi:hypothetical protein
MPNGGSDCCATCWFNARNEGETRRSLIPVAQEALEKIEGGPMKVGLFSERDLG